MVCVYIESLVRHDWPFCLHFCLHLQGKISNVISVAWSAKLLDKLVHMQLIHALSCLHNGPGLFAYRQQRSACRRPNLACAYNNQPYLIDGSCQGGLGMESWFMHLWLKKSAQFVDHWPTSYKYVVQWVTRPIFFREMFIDCSCTYICMCPISW